MEVRGQAHAEARHKRITGSRIATLMNGGYKAWNTLSAMLWDPKPEIFYTLEDTPGMPGQLRRGQILEPQARAHFFFEHPEYEIELPTFLTPDMCDVKLVGDLNDWIGISPDAILISEEYGYRSGLELKCPAYEKFLQYKALGDVPYEHSPQVYLSMLVTGSPNWWYACYFDGNDEHPEDFFEVQVTAAENALYLELMCAKLHDFIAVHKEHGVFGPKDASLKQLQSL